MVESSTPMIDPQLTDAATSHLLTGGEDMELTKIPEASSLQSIEL